MILMLRRIRWSRPSRVLGLVQGTLFIILCLIVIDTLLLNNYENEFSLAIISRACHPSTSVQIMIFHWKFVATNATALSPFNLHDKVIVWPFCVKLGWLLDRASVLSHRSTSCRPLSNFMSQALVVRVGNHFMDFGSPREKLVVCGRETTANFEPCHCRKQNQH